MEIARILEKDQQEVRTAVRKGDEKKQDILTVAEKLFCLRGYRETSVQDILDALKTSKGSFYHHFESKDAVLITICSQRAEKAYASAVAALEQCDDPLKRINILLHAAMPIRQEETAFLSMLLPLLLTQEGRTVAGCYQDALRDAFKPLLAQELTSAAAAQVIFPPKQPALADLVLTITNRCWLHAADLMLQSILQAKTASPAMLDEELSLYRTALERLLDAPYGSLEIVRLRAWFDVAQTLERRVHVPK